MHWDPDGAQDRSISKLRIAPFAGKHMFCLWMVVDVFRFHLDLFSLLVTSKRSFFFVNVLNRFHNMFFSVLILLEVLRSECLGPGHDEGFGCRWRLRRPVTSWCHDMPW